MSHRFRTLPRIRIAMAMTFLACGGLTVCAHLAHADTGFYCFNGQSRIPKTDAVADANGWGPGGATQAELLSRAKPDKRWGPPYRKHEICIVFIDPGHTTYADFGDGTHCATPKQKTPVDPCSAGDTPQVSDGRQ